MPQGSGRVKVSLIRNGNLPLVTESVDVVYCISVLEHIPDFETTIAEAFRVLRPGGLLILTVDLDLCGYLHIGSSRYRDMRRALKERFVFTEPEVTTHPMEMLIRHPAPKTLRDRLRRVRFGLRQVARVLAGRGAPRVYPNLTVWGAVMKRRTRPACPQA